MSILGYFYDEIEKIADSLDYERYESEGGARREGNPWTPMDNSETESHPTKVKELKKVLKNRLLNKKKLKLKDKDKDKEVKVLTNNGTEYEEDDPEKESYKEKIAQAIQKGNNKVHPGDLI